MSRQSEPLFVVTYADIAVLPSYDFDTFWKALGIIVRARATAFRVVESPVPSPVIEPVSTVQREPEPVVVKPQRAKPVAGQMPPFLRRIMDALLETNGDRTAAAAKLGTSSVSLNGTLSKLRHRTDLTPAEQAVIANHARSGKVHVIPDGAPAPLPVKAEPSGETFEERRQRIARERHAQTWRELHPDATA